MKLTFFTAISFVGAGVAVAFGSATQIAGALALVAAGLIADSLLFFRDRNVHDAESYKKTDVAVELAKLQSDMAALKTYAAFNQ